MEEFIGTIKLFGFNFAPRGWAQCNGQLLAIAQNSTLFSLLGNTYGGDGVTTFALPDYRGRAPIHFGQGSGLANYNIGQKAGSENVTLTSNQLPSHNHALTPASLPITGSLSVNASLQASALTGSSATPAAGNVLSTTNDAAGTGADVQIYSANAPTVALGGLSVTVTPSGMTVNTTGVATANTGGNNPVDLLNPYLAANFCICLEGVYPSRN